MYNEPNNMTVLEQNRETESGCEIKTLAFILGEETFCIDVENAREVIEMKNLTRLPYVPAGIRGVMNLRGEIISVINLGHFLGIKSNTVTKESRIIITDVEDHLVGVYVDKVIGTVSFDSEDIQLPIATYDDKMSDFIQGQIRDNEKIYILLRMNHILRCPEMEQLRNEYWN